MTVSYSALDQTNWENGATGLTADEVLTLPAGHASGQLLLIIAAWKDFAITAQVTGYTEITEFADGSVATGNGVGSMKVGAWWKIDGGAEGTPTLDFSTTTGLVGEASMMSFSKSLANWATPRFVTAAWPLSSSQTVSASSTVDIPNGAAVCALLGVRDDSSTLTHGTTAIDDSGGLITWNGNYLEGSTHASTTTGNDMAADFGSRKVTTGANGVTLRYGATLAASETASILWIVIADEDAAVRVPKGPAYAALLAQ